ncbi:MAG: tRNA (N6-threonylcarbamoyladenosine(37)-N6)-methyltransferase TrmO [Oscillospiraceae bacterium]|nr:tRNA (N6-threonylcarbamoyladenosine(37)-N6)-methyltransferase TrmO [Oscillospiraceae bacterium]
MFEIRPIAHMVSDFPEKFGIPRQAGVVKELESVVVFEPEYRDPEALRGIEGFSHLWLIWQFSESLTETFSPTVRPPRLGGNVRMGVFATRSPFRPNSLGLSCVELERVENRPGLGTVLVVRGADLMDGTPIFDIKPYIPYADAHPDARSGFAPDAGQTLNVRIPDELLLKVPESKREALRGVLANDPRPRYQKDPDRVYALDFAGLTVRFSVLGGELTVSEIEVQGGKANDQNEKK